MALIVVKYLKLLEYFWKTISDNFSDTDQAELYRFHAPLEESEMTRDRLLTGQASTF